MNRKLLIILFFISLGSFCVAQNVKDVDAVFIRVIPKRKLLPNLDNGTKGLSHLNYIDTAYTLVVTVKTDSLQLNEKLFVLIGNAKDNGGIVNTKYKFVDHGFVNKRCMHLDDVNNIEIGEFQNGFTKIYFDIDVNSFNNANFLTVYRKIGNKESNREYYEIK